MNFVASWHDSDFEGVLAKGTPIAQCIPVRRDDIDYAFDTLDGDAADRFRALRANVDATPGLYRKARRVKT